MSREYYSSLDKTTILKDPEKYPWNCVLAYIQFTQAELLEVRSHIDLRAMIKYQQCVTRAFLHTHFAADIDTCHDIGWEQVDYMVPK